MLHLVSRANLLTGFAEHLVVVLECCSTQARSALKVTEINLKGESPSTASLTNAETGCELDMPLWIERSSLRYTATGRLAISLSTS